MTARPGRHRACTGGLNAYQRNVVWALRDGRWQTQLGPWFRTLAMSVGGPCGGVDCTACAPVIEGEPVWFSPTGMGQMVAFPMGSLPKGYTHPHQFNGKPVGIGPGWWLVTGVECGRDAFALQVRPL